MEHFDYAGAVKQGRTADWSKAAHSQLEKAINKGREEGARVVAQVMETIPEDRMVAHRALRFDTFDNDPLMVMVGPEINPTEMGIHRSALHQVADRVRIPARYVDELMEDGPWGKDLLADSLNTLLEKRPKKGTRFLVRSVDGQIRGVLSDKFRRLDSRPVLDALLGVIQSRGAVVVGGHAGETQVTLKAILPEVIDPLGGDPVVFGIQFRNSDFGHARLTVSTCVMRLACINLMVNQRELTQVHLGGRLPENVALSQETYALDTRTMASAVKDLGGHLLSQEYITGQVKRLQLAGEEEIDAKAALNRLRKRMTKEEADKVAEAYNGPDVVNLPPGNTRWRFSNAISFLARDHKNGDRRTELEALAGAELDRVSAAA